MKFNRFAAVCGLLLFFAASTGAQTPQDKAIQDLRAQLEQLKSEYEQRIQGLEKQIIARLKMWHPERKTEAEKRKENE